MKCPYHIDTDWEINKPCSECQKLNEEQKVLTKNSDGSFTILRWAPINKQEIEQNK